MLSSSQTIFFCFGLEAYEKHTIEKEKGKEKKTRIRKLIQYAIIVNAVSLPSKIILI